MTLNISAWSIRNPLPPIVMAVAILALGWVNFTKLPITRKPNVDVPIVTVVVTQFGASPGELELQVTKKVEDAVAGVLAWGAGGEFRSPMAISVIGGLIVSTLLSLLFVPAFFTIMDDAGRLSWWVFGRFIGKVDEPVPVAAANARIATHAVSFVEVPTADQPSRPSAEAPAPAKVG